MSGQHSCSQFCLLHVAVSLDAAAYCAAHHFWPQAACHQYDGAGALTPWQLPHGLSVLQIILKQMLHDERIADVKA